MTDHVDPTDEDSIRAFAYEQTRNRPAGASVMRSMMSIRTSDDDPEEDGDDPVLFEILIDEPGLLPTFRVRFSRDFGETWHELDESGSDPGLVWFIGAGMYGAIKSREGMAEDPDR